MAAGGTVVLNPYVWPYSGTQCVDDLYIANEDKGLNVGIDSTSLYSLTTPDHAVVTN